MKITQLRTLLLWLTGALLAASSCTTQGNGNAKLEAGQLWHNGNEIYEVEDSDSVWNLFGGTLNEGGYEMRLPKQGGDWKLEKTDGQTAIVLYENGKASDVLLLAEGVKGAGRDKMYDNVTTVLDSVVTHVMLKLIEGDYADSYGSPYFIGDHEITFGSNRYKFHFDKPMGYYENVLVLGDESDKDSKAFAYKLTSPRQLALTPAHYEEDPGYYAPNEGARAIVLTNATKHRFAKIFGSELMPKAWMQMIVVDFSDDQRTEFVNTLKAQSGNNATLKTNIEILETAIANIRQMEEQMKQQRAAIGKQ